MTRYILIYKGKTTDMVEMSPVQGKAVMEAWQTWIEKTGEGLVDIGAPRGSGESIVDNGTTGKALD